MDENKYKKTQSNTLRISFLQFDNKRIVLDLTEIASNSMNYNLYLNQADGIIFMYDVTDRTTF